MTLSENGAYLQENYIRFQEGDSDVKEAIIEELKVNGFIDEADELQAEVDDTNSMALDEDDAIELAHQKEVDDFKDLEDKNLDMLANRE